MKQLFDKFNQWESNSDDKIWVNEHYNPDSEGSYRQLTYSEFAESQGFKPIELIVPDVHVSISDIFGPPTDLEMTAILNNPYAKLGLEKMAQPLGSPPIKGLGYGVKYLPSADKPLKKGTVVSQYAGVVKKPSTLGEQDYIFSVSSLSIDAKSRGNISRFFTHLPCSLELKLFVMPRRIRAQIARDNIDIQVHMHDGELGLPTVTNRDVQPGEILGINYNIDYFLNRGTLPTYYDKQGNPLDMSKITFDKRRFLILFLFKDIVDGFTEFTMQHHRVPVKPSWSEAIKNIALSIYKAYSNEEPFFQLEADLKEIFADFKKQMIDEGLAELLARITGQSSEIVKQSIETIERVLFMDGNSPYDRPCINKVFHARMPDFPRRHPRAQEHTLHLNKPKPSQAGVFAQSQSQPKPDDEPFSGLEKGFFKNGV